MLANCKSVHSQTIALGWVFVIILIGTLQLCKRHDTYKKKRERERADKKAKCGTGLWNISYLA